MRSIFCVAVNVLKWTMSIFSSSAFSLGIDGDSCSMGLDVLLSWKDVPAEGTWEPMDPIMEGAGWLDKLGKLGNLGEKPAAFRLAMNVPQWNGVFEGVEEASSTAGAVRERRRATLSTARLANLVSAAFKNPADITPFSISLDVSSKSMHSKEYDKEKHFRWLVKVVKCEDSVGILLV